MKRFFALCLILFLSAACGKKGDPHPIESLNIPPPVWAEISVEEDGVHITNSSDDYPIFVERAESELGALFFPLYQTIATVKPQSSFLDNGTKNNVRYIYRIRTIHNKYDEYSAPVTKVISYRGVVAVESLTWYINEETLCLNIRMSRDVADYRVMINGNEMDITQRCHPFPKMPTILLIVVPFSDSGIPGSAYSENIDIEKEGILVPPQNIKILRREKQITLSWDAVTGAERYDITVAGDSGKTIADSTNSTIYNSDLTNEDKCTEFTLVSIDKNRRSEPVQVQSCP